jgi:hypothetical protein
MLYSRRSSVTEEESIIFDWVIQKEDEYLLNIRDNIINDSFNKYGELGKKVAKKYFDDIDGVLAEEQTTTESTGCEECEEKRKEVSGNLKLIDDISEITQTYSYDFIKKNLTIEQIDFINESIIHIVKHLLESTLYKYDMDELKKSILIQLFKKQGGPKNDISIK